MIKAGEYRDEEFGFILTIYNETKDTYRIPHNHGNAWVVYVVVVGEVEMGNFINGVKHREILKQGDGRKYLPGDIHDTRCLSTNAVILRLTSCDLRIEEKEGRMLRFENL